VKEPRGDVTGASAPVPSDVRDGSWTVMGMVRWAGEYLVAKGVVRGRLDAEHLLGHVLGVDRLHLYLQFDRPLTREDLDAFRPLLRRRAKREPLQYVLGRAAFRELTLRVDGRVLIPRPETEELVDVVLAWARGRVDGEGRGGLTALDVGTGSGCIALSLAMEGPFTRVLGTDPSPEALALAERNALDAGAAPGVVAFRAGSFFDSVEGERFDAVVSNPPYVAEGEAADLEPEVRDFEPPGALFAGADGLDVIGPLVRGAAGHLAPGGLLALEVGLGQSERVMALIRATAEFAEPSTHRDLSRRPRIVTAIRQGAERP